MKVIFSYNHVNKSKTGSIIFFIHFVAHARRRGDRLPTKNKCKFNVMGGYIWSMWGDKEFVVS